MIKPQEVFLPENSAEKQKIQELLLRQLVEITSQVVPCRKCHKIESSYDTKTDKLFISIKCKCKDSPVFMATPAGLPESVTAWNRYVYSE